MNSNSEVAIVIPLYKKDINDYERISLAQIFKVLGQYSIIFVAPVGFEFNFIPETKSIYYFDEIYFKDLHGYNKLLTSVHFYSEFLSYKYILIAQLDTFIFKDDLKNWCKKGYDYIGAPWMFDISLFNKTIINYYPATYRNKILRFLFNKEYFVGNGGLSLRKVKTFYKILNAEKNKHLIDYFRNEATKAIDNEISEIADNEDNFWCLFVPNKITRLRIPNYKKAMKFAFETAPDLCYQLNHKELPFGCHAWDKHNFEFWKQFIKAQGYNI